MKQILRMPSITPQVWKYISNDTSIKKLLARKLLNNRALAKRIIKDLGLITTTESVVSAIRRYDNWESESDEIYKKARELLKKSSFSSKSNVVCIAIKKDESIKNILPSLFNVINFSKGEVLRIIQGGLSIKLIIDEHNLKKVLEIIPEQIIINIMKGLAELDVVFSEESVKTPGLVSVVVNELSSNGINMEEVLTCVPELIILINENDFLKTMKIFYKLIKEI